jgi:hypothetical protein
MKVDISGAEDVARRFSDIAHRQHIYTYNAVKKAAQDLKDVENADFQGSAYHFFQRVRFAYNIHDYGSRVVAEVGSLKGTPRQADYIGVFGTYKGGGFSDFAGHAIAEAPALQHYVSLAVLGMH